MIITYFILVLIAIVFKLLHFPGASLILLISPLFPLIDILIQAIRKKENKETRVLSSISLFFISLFILFKFLYWPLSSVLFVLALILSIVTLVRFFQKKIAWNMRYVLFAIIFLFAAFNFSIKQSSFRLAYMLEDPFNPKDDVPEFIIQRLAYDFYHEGDYAKAEQLIQQNIFRYSSNQERKDQRQSWLETNQRNLQQSQSDLEAIKHRNWDNFIPVEHWF